MKITMLCINVIMLMIRKEVLLISKFSLISSSAQSPTILTENPYAVLLTNLWPFFPFQSLWGTFSYWDIVAIEIDMTLPSWSLKLKVWLFLPLFFYRLISPSLKYKIRKVLEKSLPATHFISLRAYSWESLYTYKKVNVWYIT